MHRFLSALAHREDAKVLEYDVRHRERQIGTSNYTNFGRLIVGISDILGVYGLEKECQKIKFPKRFLNEFNILSVNANRKVCFRDK